jgi:hypothetical protein
MLALILIILMIPTSFAKECIVISGAKKDHNGAFRGLDILVEKQSFNGWDCTVFDSWFSADIYLRQKRLPAGSDLLILQGTHGSKGGGAACNSGDVDGEQIYTFLEKYASQYKTAALIDSCYSGDLMKRKIKADLIKGDRPEMKNLCLATSSYFNQVSYSSNSIFKMEDLKNSKDKSIEEYMSQQRDYLISSSPWSGLGISNYFSMKDVNEARNLLEQLNGAFTPECHEGASDLLKLCSTSEGISLLQEATKYVESIEEIIKEIPDQIKNLDAQIATLKKTFESDEKNDALKYKIACLEDLKQHTQFYIDGYFGSEDPQEYLKRTSADLKKDGYSCGMFLDAKKKLLEKNPPPVPVSPVSVGGAMTGVYGGYAGGGMVGGNMGGGGFGGYPAIATFIDPEIDQVAFSAIQFKLFNFESIKTGLEKQIGAVHKDITPKDLMQSLEGKMCSSSSAADVQLLAEFLLGERYLHSNQENSAYPKRKNNSFSPNQILKGLSRLTKNKEGEHPHDKIRREACESFKL